MDITLNPSSGVPLYQQIYENIRRQILNGMLDREYCLPPIRTIAKELRISVITVKKAWEQLENDGYIYTITGKGCFVAPMKSDELMDKRYETAYQKMKKDVHFYRHLGFSLEEITKLLENCYNEDAGKRM